MNTLKLKYVPNIFYFYKKQITPLNLKKQRSNEINANLYYSHGETNSCEVIIAFFGNIAFTVKSQLNDSKSDTWNRNRWHRLSASLICTT